RLVGEAAHDAGAVAHLAAGELERHGAPGVRAADLGRSEDGAHAALAEHLLEPVLPADGRSDRGGEAAGRRGRRRGNSLTELGWGGAIVDGTSHSWTFAPTDRSIGGTRTGGRGEAATRPRDSSGGGS